MNTESLYIKRLSSGIVSVYRLKVFGRGGSQFERYDILPFEGVDSGGFDITYTPPSRIPDGIANMTSAPLAERIAYIMSLGFQPASQVSAATLAWVTAVLSAFWGARREDCFAPNECGIVQGVLYHDGSTLDVNQPTRLTMLEDALFITQ